MQNKPHVYTINNAAPPSYTEAIEQVPMGNNSYVNPFYQQTSQNQGHTSLQMSSNAQPTAPYPYPPTTTMNPQHESLTTLYPNTTIITVENTTQKYVKAALCCRILAIICSIICFIFIMVKVLP